MDAKGGSCGAEEATFFMILAQRSFARGILEAGLMTLEHVIHLLPQDILEAESVDAQGVPQRDFGAVSMTLM